MFPVIASVVPLKVAFVFALTTVDDALDVIKLLAAAQFATETIP
jgi:hypothetical protein